MNGAPQLLRTARAVLRHPHATRAELKAYQDAQLRRLLVHAYERVPYYRRLFDAHRLHPRHIRGTVDLHLLPTVTKEDLRGRRQEQVLASGLDFSRLLRVRTSGSSGEPFTIHRTWWEDKLQYLLRLRAFRELGIRYADRVGIVGLNRVRQTNDRKVTGRALRALGVNPTLRLDGLMEPATLAAQLREFRPDVLSGMPGLLARLADHLLASGDPGPRPRMIVSGGEVLTPIIRRRLEQAFGAVIRESYGSHEFPLLAWECPPSGQFHSCDDGVILEVLREGCPAQPGESGEVVATNLHAYAMPFIRYRLGDVVTRGDDFCPCGQPFLTIRGIQGRILDSFALPDGRVIHPYQILASFIDGGDTWVRQYQLVQERSDRIVLRVLPAGSPAREHLTRVEQSVLGLLGAGMEFQVELVDRIPPDPTGKFRPSRSLLHSRPGSSSHAP